MLIWSISEIEGGIFYSDLFLTPETFLIFSMRSFASFLSLHMVASFAVEVTAEHFKAAKNSNQGTAFQSAT